MQHVHTIIQPKWILTVNPLNETLTDSSLIIDQGKVLDICPNQMVHARYTANNYYYLENHAIFPGFVNAHTHNPMTLLRGLADDLPLMTWLQEHIWPAERATVCEAFVEDGLKLAMAEMLRGGTTCFSDHYFYTETAAKIVAQAKMRANLAECIFHFGTPWSPTPEIGFQRTEVMVDLCRASALVKATLGPHSPYGTTADIMDKVYAVAKQHNLPIHIHLHETQGEVDDYKKAFGISPLQHYDELGFLGPHFQAVHMTAVTDEEIEIIARTGTHVIHCPESNMKLASGICPVQKLLDHGINVALGTDGAASNNDLDMIGEMRSAAYLAKISTRNPEAVNAATVLRMATINGAKALGIADKVGSLEIGKFADIAAIDLGQAETMPCFNPTAQLVYAASRNQITHTWVEGKALLQDRNLTTLNENEILEKAKAWQEKIQSALVKL